MVNRLAAHEIPDSPGLRFSLIGYFVPRLPFDPVELVEELEGLRGWTSELVLSTLQPAH
ncbi:hypothetical protein [Sphingobium sp. MK2]|uniref:hypothetical protein n=1 Tax=Sphingobium sp. MK2 TaxID=3116540 RepID=UPI0032E36592